MSTFTPRQQAVLMTISNCLQLFAKHYTMDVGLQLSNRIKAITNVLVEKGVCAEEDIEQALEAVEEDSAILRSLDPEIQAALAEFNDIVRGLREETPPRRRRGKKKKAPK